MKCQKCGNQMLKTTGRYRYDECGLDYVFLSDTPMLFCEDCSVTIPLLPDPRKTTKSIAEQLVCLPSKLDGDAVLFLRKAMGLRGQDLATVLNVDRVTVSRWENRNTQIDGVCDFKLRLKAIRQVCSPSEHQRLREEVVDLFEKNYPSDVREFQITVQCPKVTLEHTRDVALTRT